VTVVIPARNAAATIEAQLAALADQDYPGELKVIVADNGSTDDTTTRALRWADRLPGLRVVDASARRGVAHARNAATAVATSELVLVCDADDVVDPAWARHLVAGLTTADAVAGGIADFVDGIPDAAPTPAPFGTAGFGFLPALTGASCGYRRGVWEAVGGFDESVAMAASEDVDFAWRLQLAGYSLAQVPDGFVWYRQPATPGAVLRKWYRYGRSQPPLLRRFRAQGLRPEPAPRVVAGWARLVIHAYRLVGGDAAARRRWCRDAGRRAGRLVGSVRERSWYL
jgi:cellulose synthase/poly-beta-1,6-N-acetylglucosamine synthase-like glycosyltransferase